MLPWVTGKHFYPRISCGEITHAQTVGNGKTNADIFLYLCRG